MEQTKRTALEIKEELTQEMYRRLRAEENIHFLMIEMLDMLMNHLELSSE